MSQNFVSTNQEIFQSAIEILDSTPATSTSASLCLAGGLTIFNTNSSLNFNSGGALLVLGGAAIQQNVIIGGITQILNTTISTNTSTGSLQISGGLSIQGSAYGVYSNFNYIQANVGGTIPTIISSNISVGTLSVNNLNSVNITCQNLYLTNSITTSNLIVNNISTNSLYINSTSSTSIPTIFGYNSNNTQGNGLAFSSWNGTTFTEKFRFDSIGNFLINTTQPTISNTLYLNSLSTAGSDGITLDTQFSINPVIGLSVQGSRKYTIGIDNNDLYKFKFNRGLFGSGINTMTLDQNGNVGIGTVTPTSNLQVIGDTNISGNVTAGISFYTPTATIGSLNSNNLSLSNLTSGSAYIVSTTASINTNTGALIINGGLGVGGAANIGGNLSIAGNLTVSGTTITINTTNVSIQDNFLGLNYGPTGQADTGLILSRYQIANNSGSGDTVNDTIGFTGNLVSGSTTTSIIFNITASSTTGFYTGYWIKITSGININQVRQVTSYNGTTKTATLATPLTNTPTVGDTLNLYGNVYVLSYFNYSTNQFILGYSSITFGSLVPSIVNYANLYLNNLNSNLVTTNNLQVTNATITNLSIQGLSIANLIVSNLFSVNNSLTNLITTNQSVSNQYIVNGTITNQTVSNLNGVSTTLGNANVNNITVGSLNVTGISNLSGGLVQSINQTGTNATISNMINSNITTVNLIGTNSSISNIISFYNYASNLFSVNASILNINNTNSNIIALTVGSLNISSGLLTVNNVNNVSLTTSNLLVNTLISTSNLVSSNNTLPNIASNNITATNAIITNMNNLNLSSTNGLFSNITVTNGIFTSATSTNLFINNATANNILIINSTAYNIFGTNISASTLSVSNVNLINITGTNSLFTNNTTTNSIITNSIITNLSTGALSVINSNTTNFTAINSKTTNQTIGTINMTNLIGINSTITNSVGINLNYTNISVSSLNVPNLTINNLSLGNLITTNITAVNFLLSGTNNASNIIYIDCQNSQTFPGQLIFKNSYGTGDFRIYGDGGDVQWQGGGGRACQMGAWHEIRLTGGRISAANIPFINGSNSTFNTIIQNLNNSIGLLVQGGSGQSVDLTQWSNNSSTVLSRIDYLGNLQVTSTADTISSGTGGSITTSGGISVAKAVNIGSTIVSTNNSNGALVVSGGAGFNGSIYANNFYSYQGTSTVPVALIPSPLTTKGDLDTYSTTETRLPAGTYGQVLISNTSTSTGLQWTNPLIIPGIYGSEYNYNSSKAISGTTSTRGALKCSLTTGSLLGGTYKIEINYTITQNTSTAQNSEIAVYINTNSTTGFEVGLTTSNLIHETIYLPQSNLFSSPISSTVVQTFGNTVQTVGLYIRNQGGLTNGANNQVTNIGYASLLLYRIQ